MEQFGFNDLDANAQFREGDDVGGTFETAQAIEIDGGLVSGTINSISDVDYFRIDVEAGQVLRFGLFDDGLGVEGAADPGFFAVRNFNGDIVAQGLDTRDGLEATNFTVVEDGARIPSAGNSEGNLRAHGSGDGAPLPLSRRRRHARSPRTALLPGPRRTTLSRNESEWVTPGDRAVCAGCNCGIYKR